MATYSEITTLLTSGPYIDGKNWITSAEGKSKFKGLCDYDLNPKSLLSDYYDDTFKVGVQNTFEDIAVVYEANVNKAIDIMNDYASTASAAKAAIEAAIAKDAEAAKLAKEAYDSDTNLVYDTVEVVNDAGQKEKVKKLNAEKTLAAREAAYAKTWDANCWKPGK